jgi:hypothetical protein
MDAGGDTPVSPGAGRRPARSAADLPYGAKYPLISRITCVELLT